jgi:hypothetical protein
MTHNTPPVDARDEFLEHNKAFVKNTPKGEVVVKAASAAPRSWNKQKRRMRFIMSTEQEDRGRDIVVQAGIDMKHFLALPVAPLFHSTREFPVGKWEDIEQYLEGRPVRTEGTLQLLPEGEEPNADRLAKHFDFGTIAACSVGFIPKKMERREVPKSKEGEYFYPGYKILESELVECSPVLLPANPGSLAKAAEMDDKLPLELLEEVLDNWARHPETGLLVPREEAEAWYKDLTGQRASRVVVPSQAFAIPKGVQGEQRVILASADSSQPPLTMSFTENDAVISVKVNEVVTFAEEGPKPIPGEHKEEIVDPPEQKGLVDRVEQIWKHLTGADRREADRAAAEAAKREEIRREQELAVQRLGSLSERLKSRGLEVGA